MARYFVGITGASGHVYATELIRALVRNGQEVDLAATPAGLLVLRHELGVDGGPNGEQLGEVLDSWLGPEIARGVRTFPCDAVGARAASGTSLTGGVILAPCSMGTLARVSVGFSSNLVERAADVAIKEGRQLVLMPREAPLSEIHLENMLRQAKMGAIVLPCDATRAHACEFLPDDHLRSGGRRSVEDFRSIAAAFQYRLAATSISRAPAASAPRRIVARPRPRRASGSAWSSSMARSKARVAVAVSTSARAAKPRTVWVRERFGSIATARSAARRHAAMASWR